MEQPLIGAILSQSRLPELVCPNYHSTLAGLSFNEGAVDCKLNRATNDEHFHVFIQYQLSTFCIPVFSLCFTVSEVVSETNSLYRFVNLILVPVPPFPTHLFLHPSLPRMIHNPAHPLLSLSFTPDLNLPVPTPLVSLFLPDCLHGLLPELFLLSYSVFVFSF